VIFQRTLRKDVAGVFTVCLIKHANAQAFAVSEGQLLHKCGLTASVYPNRDNTVTVIGSGPIDRINLRQLKSWY